MSRKSVYLETSFISYLTARPSRNLVTAAHQMITHEWWETRRDKFDLFISELVIVEAQRGDTQAAEHRLTVIQDMALLDLSIETEQFAQALLEHMPFRKKLLKMRLILQWLVSAILTICLLGIASILPMLNALERLRNYVQSLVMSHRLFVPLMNY